MLIYASMVNVSVGRMFFAGIVPGVINVLAFLLFVVWRAETLRLEARGRRAPSSACQSKFAAARRAFWVLMLPAFVLYGFYSGDLTATEISTACAVYSAVVALWVYRSIRFRDLWPVIMQTARTTINIFTIIAGAVLLSKVLTFLNAPQLIFGFVEHYHLNAWQFLIAVSAIMFILGMFMEAVALNVMTTPILAPIAMKLGIDPGALRHRADLQHRDRADHPARGAEPVRARRGGQGPAGDDLPRGAALRRDPHRAAAGVYLRAPAVAVAARPPAAGDLRGAVAERW